MSFFDKLMFWKRNDDFGKSPDMNFETGGNADLNWGQNSSLNNPMDTLNNNPQNPDFVFDPQLPKSQGNMDIGYQNESARFGLGTNDNMQNNLRQPNNNFGLRQHPQHTFSQAPPQQPIQDDYPQQGKSKDYEYIITKELEVVSSKIDTLKAVLESVNQRVASLERLAYAQQQQETQKQRW